MADHASMLATVSMAVSQEVKPATTPAPDKSKVKEKENRTAVAPTPLTAALLRVLYDVVCMPREVIGLIRSYCDPHITRCHAFAALPLSGSLALPHVAIEPRTGLIAFSD